LGLVIAAFIGATVAVLDVVPARAAPTATSTSTAPPSSVQPTVPPGPTYPPVTVLRSTPVRGPVVDPWRPPSTPYGPGNRGVDVGTRPGALVVSPADGTVSFAGAVGNSRFVVVASTDGIRITVGFLASVRVRTGQVVRRGQPIGTAGARVHIGARIGEDYVDPTPLFSHGPPHVRLVPVPGSSPPRLS
jgi:septal ring factor EnvC (AmiA/AmiB activator)